MIRAGFLSVLSIKDKPMSQFEVGEQIFRTPSSISSLSRKMEKEGLIQRRKAPSDRKYQMITLTEKGKQAARQCDTDAEEILAEMFSSLNAEELKTLGDLLGKVVDDLTEKHGRRAGWYQKTG